MNYSINNLQRQNEISQSVKPDSELTFCAETLNLFLYGGFFIFLIHKHKAHLGPVHIFELVALMDLFVWLLCSISNKLTMLQEFRRDPLFCYGMKIVEHASVFCWASNTISSQLEMFLSIYSNVYYITNVTSWKAMLTFLLINGSMIILSVVVTPLLPSSLLCPADTQLWSHITDTKHFYFNIIPELAILVVLIMVGAYITYIHFNPPVHNVHLPPPITIQLQPPQVEQDIIIENMEDEEFVQPPQSPDTTNFSVHPKPVQVSSQEASLPALPPNHLDPDIVVEDLHDEQHPCQMPNTQDSCRNIPTISARVDSKEARSLTRNHRIKRKDENPFMFFRVPPSPPPPPPSPPGQCLPSGLAEALENVRKCLKINIMSLCVIGLLVPDCLLHTYFIFFCTDYEECYTPVFIFFAEYFVTPFYCLFSVLYPFLVKKKLDNFMS